MQPRAETLRVGRLIVLDTLRTVGLCCQKWNVDSGSATSIIGTLAPARHLQSAGTVPEVPVQMCWWSHGLTWAPMQTNHRPAPGPYLSRGPQLGIIHINLDLAIHRLLFAKVNNCFALRTNRTHASMNSN